MNYYFLFLFFKTTKNSTNDTSTSTNNIQSNTETENVECTRPSLPNDNFIVERNLFCDFSKTLCACATCVELYLTQDCAFLLQIQPSEELAEPVN